MVFIIMGVSGCGKTTIGKLLAERLHCPFFDADDFHTSANKKKMADGTPLTDKDRLPWLKKLRAYLKSCYKKHENCVLACSALKQSYRDSLTFDAAKVTFIFLKGDMQLIAGRLKSRAGHYMNPSLLQSQFNTLEEPENALVIDISESEENIVTRLVKMLSA
jgi:gluconokinase